MKWTDSFKKLKLQHYSNKRVSPLVDKPSVIHEEEKPIPVIIVGEEGLTTPDLSENDSFSEKEEEVLFDGDDELTDTDERPLPPLPTDTSLGLKRSITSSKLAIKGQEKLKRAATWLGLASQKVMQSSSQQQLKKKTTKYQSASSLQHFLRLVHTTSNNTSQNNFPAIVDDIGSYNSSSSSLVSEVLEQSLRIQTDQLSQHVNKKTLIAPKRIVYIQVKQIINSASTRDCEYELEIKFNNETLGTKKGYLCKVNKDTSASSILDEPLVFEIEESFELDFLFAARPISPSASIREGLAKLKLMPPSLVSTKQSILPVVSQKKLCFENKEEATNMSRIQLTNNSENNKWLNIELVVDVQVEEILPALVEQFPWAFTTNELSAVPEDEDRTSTLEDAFELPLSQEYCRGGDYLTIYTRGLAHPVWRRFWVTIEDEQLKLYDFSYKGNKEPLYVIPLVPLLSLTKPSFDDYENVGISRKTGLMLYFNKNHAILNEPVRFVEEEGLEGKLFAYADSEQGAIHWRRTLGAYLSHEDRATESDQRIDLRFLW
jgi:hypothetical protein